MARVLVALALSDLGRDALKFVMALALAILLALAFSVSTLMTVLGATVPGHEVAERGLLDPTASFIQKPFSPEELALRVRGMLDSRGPLPRH